MDVSSVQVQVITLVSLLLFCILMVYIGFHTSHKTKTLDGFLLGGRKIGAWMSAFAYGTSYFSAVIFIGYAGKNGWDIGFASIWIGIGNAVLGCLLAWFVLAKKTRQMTHNLNSKTMPEFFEGRYGSTNMKIYSAIIIFLFLVPYSSAVYKGLGSMFNTIFPNIPVNICMLVVAIITSIFLVLGGYVAAVYTDCIQGIIMIIGTVLMVILLTFNDKVGGLTSAYEKLNSFDAELIKIFGGQNWKFLLINILLTSFGTWGLPQMINKYYAVKDNNAIKKATVVSTIFAAIIGIGAYYTGTLGRVYMENTLPLNGYDYIVPNTLFQALGNASIFSNFVLALIMVLLLSASMSTLSSIVLTSSSAITVDLIPQCFPKFQKNNQVLLTRIFCLVFVLMSYIFATMNFAIIVSIMSFSWGVVSGSFIGPYFFGLYWRKTTTYGAWVGMLGGILTIGILTIIQTASAGFSSAISNAPVYGVLAMAVSMMSTAIVSLFTPKIDSSIIDKAFN